MNRNEKLMQYTMHVNTVLMGVGFFMLMPLLSVYLYNVKYFTAVMVGYIMSARAVAYDSFSIFGGALGDVIGCKKTMIAGCTARIISFLIFGFCEGLPMYIFAGALIGLGGSLFLPACSAYYDMMSNDQNRAQMYALQSMLDNSGNIIGPALGTILMGLWGFKAMCVLCALIYFASVVITFLFLPELRNEKAKDAGVMKNVVSNITECASNKKFIIFLLATVMLTFLQLQKDLAVPVKLAEIAPDYAVGFMYTITATIGVAMQMPMVKFMKKHFSSWDTFSFVYIIYALGFAVIGFGGSIATLYIGTTLYTLALSLHMPMKSAQMAEYAGRGKVAGYYGFQGLVGVFVSLMANLLGGWLYDISAPLTGIMHYLPWLVFISISAVSVLIIRMLDKEKA